MKKTFISIIGLILIIMGTKYMNSFASSGTRSIGLPANSATVYDSNVINRNINYSYILARAISVYPTGGGVDNYIYADVAVCNTGLTRISSSYRLNENNTSATKLYLYDGTLSTKSVELAFSNAYSNYVAQTLVYSYDGK